MSDDRARAGRAVSDPGVPPGRLCDVMVWIVTAIVLGVLALAAIGYCGLRVWRNLRTLTKEVKRVTPVLTEAAAPVQAELARLQAAGGAHGESLSPVR